MRMKTNTPYNAQACKRLGSVGCVTWCATLLCLLSARIAQAHPGPAEPPEFPAGPCVTVIDKSKQTQYDLSYYVTIDDTAIDLATDIPLPDAKSHQFFALAGTVIPNGETFRFYPFDIAESDPVLLPYWITVGDVKRAAEASTQLTGTTFSAADFPHDMVLEGNADFTGRWFRISSDNARLPIRIMQSSLPVRWDLKAVPPGAYTIAGYVFSPPYNTWAMRPGVVKVIDATANPPAGAVSSITESVFSYQGRRVQVCLDVPNGTQMAAYYHVEEQPALGWMRWLDTQPVETGDLDLCFNAKDMSFSGSVRLRVDLMAPDGSVTSLHSHDTLTWLHGKGTCTESDTKCCSFAGANVATEAVDAGSVPDASAPPEASVGAAVDSGAATAQASSPAARGCSTVLIDHAWRPHGALLLLGLTLSSLRRRSLRRARCAPLGKPSACCRART